MVRHGSTVVWILLAAGLLLLPAMALAQEGNQTGQNQTNETNQSDMADGNGTADGDINTSEQSQGNASADGNDTGFGGGPAPGTPGGEGNNSSSFAQGGADGDPTAEAYTVWGTMVSAIGALTAAAFRV